MWEEMSHLIDVISAVIESYQEWGPPVGRHCGSKQRLTILESSVLFATSFTPKQTLNLGPAEVSPESLEEDRFCLRAT